MRSPAKAFEEEKLPDGVNMDYLATPGFDKGAEELYREVLDLSGSQKALYMHVGKLNEAMEMRQKYRKRIPFGDHPVQHAAC